MSGAGKKAAETTARAVARAVTREEVRSGTAPAPASSASSETMMPWRGWVQRLIKDRLGEERLNQLKNLVYYRPNDPYDLYQMPTPSMKVPLTDDEENGKKVAFREVSPGSQPPPRLPEVEIGEDPYNTAHYVRDTARRETDPAYLNQTLEQMKIALLPQDDPRVQEYKEKLAEGPGSSPGNKGKFATGQTDYDPEGLRATMSASNEALQKSLDAHMPDHLPKPDWWHEQEEVAKWYLDRDLPVPLGRTGWGTVPREGRIARW